MASWKTKGYVSDSEDDNEGIEAIKDRSTRKTLAVVEGSAENAPCKEIKATDGETPTAVGSTGPPSRVLTTSMSIPEALSHHGILTIEPPSATTLKPTAPLSTTAEKLEDSISRGLLLVREVLSRPTSPHAFPAYDDDSPLSTPPDSPLLSPVPEPTSGPNQLNADLANEHGESPMHQAVEDIAPRRALRQRNAIQEHPYSLERAVYLKHCNERGIKPVHISRGHSPTRPGKAPESEDTQFEDDSQNQDSLGQESVELDDLDRINGDPSQDLSSVDDDDVDMNLGGDLPDLQALLNRKPGKIRPRNQKRTPARTSFLQDHQIYNLSSDDELSTPPGLKPTKLPARNQQESFPSPPRSMSVDTADLQPPREHDSSPDTPAALPTPVLSSEIRPRKRPVIEDDTQSGPEDGLGQTIPSSSLAEVSEPELSSPVNVRLMQKKVKGVLPASWWTVDQAQKAFDAKKKDSLSKSGMLRQEVGVAQRKTTNTLSRDRVNRNSQAWYGDLISDGDDTDAEGTVGPDYTRSVDVDMEESELRRSTPAVNIEATLVVDDSGFDPMLANQSRRKKDQRPKQINLRGYVQEKQRSRAQVSFANRVHSKIAEQHRSRKKAKQIASSDIVHVLDAPDLRGLEPERRPSFLRLAMRQAKAQKKVPGTSASRKFFQLEDEGETMDILGELKTWKETKQVRKQAPPPAPGRGGNKQRDHQISIIDDNTYTPLPAGDELKANPRGLESRTGLEHIQVQQQQYQSLGHIIHCGLPGTEDHALRLTRLRSLLPLTNRSGHGRFATTTVQSRSAQLEVLREDYGGLRRHISRAHSIKEGTVGAGQSRTSHVQPLIQRATDGNHSSIPSRKLRKQRPVYRPILQQTRLAPSSPKSLLLESLIGQTSPEVRVLLEREFAEHQAAWFQGSKSGIMVANHKTQRHFQVFLDVLKSYLPAALQDAEADREARELRSFLHRLIPNRGQIGAQGQIGDKFFEVLEYDILVARNVFDLHICLLNLAPGYAPRPRVLEMKVNFSDAHHEICVIALGAWKAIYSYHHTDASIVDGLSGWIYSMLSQLVHRWKAAESDARTEAVRSMRRIDEQLVRKVIEHNRSQACILLAEALAALNLSIDDATAPIEANALLGHVRYQELLSTISQLSEMDDGVVERVLNLAVTYIRKQWHLQHPAVVATFLTSIRQALTNLTSTRSKCSPDLQYTMAKVYFALAGAAVTLRQRSWDEFYEPRSSHSLDMFIAENQLNSIKTCFYHLLVDQEPSQYELELRAPVLSHWLRVLLAQSDDLGCSLLTASLFRSEQESLAMSSLAAMFQSPETFATSSALQDRLPELRHATVMHIIQCLHGQENNAEADWLVGGLEEIDAVRLLRVIFSAMKETWISLGEHPEEQDIYTVLVHSALDQYELYPRADFAIDVWFLSSATFPQRRKQTFAKLFTTSFDTEEDFLKEVVEQFNHEFMHARKYGRLTSFEDELKDILLPTDVDVTAHASDHANTLLRHARFVNEVFPTIIREGHSHQSDVMTMLLQVLVHVLDNLECRIDNLDPATTRPLIGAILPVLSFVSDSHDTAPGPNQRLIYTLTRLTYEWATEILMELPEGFIADVKAICDLATKAECAEALMLLEAVMYGVSKQL